MKMRKWGAVLVASLILVLFSQFGFANVTNEEVLKRLNDLSEVIQKQQEEIRNLKQQLEQQKNAIQEAGENQKEQIKEVVKAETKEVEKSWRDKLPEWTNRIHLAGDFRLRFEDIWGRDQLQKDGSTKSLESRERVRFRFRFYIDGKISDEIMTHFMLVTNQDIYQQAPTSNQTFGFVFNDNPFWIGRAYATYKPKWLEGLEVGAGKFRMNFYHTDIMWDPDVNPEG
ncbi:MAG: putative porin, partial [Desulfobulbaceae bacterium]|nr:putative porin [Desulfobulbaceae bacterium]